MYDADVKVLIPKLETLPGTLLLSNPCIELWFLLHLMDYRRESDSKEMIRVLENRPEWGKYNKGKFSPRQADVLRRYEEACKRGINLEFRKNPSTDMHRFIEILESFKKS